MKFKGVLSCSACFHVSAVDFPPLTLHLSSCCGWLIHSFIHSLIEDTHTQWQDVCPSFLPSVRKVRSQLSQIKANEAFSYSSHISVAIFLEILPEIRRVFHIFNTENVSCWCCFCCGFYVLLVIVIVVVVACYLLFQVFLLLLCVFYFIFLYPLSP